MICIKLRALSLSSPEKMYKRMYPLRFKCPFYCTEITIEQFQCSALNRTHEKKNAHSNHLLECTYHAKIATSIRTLPCHHTPVTIKYETRAELFLMRLLWILSHLEFDMLSVTYRICKDWTEAEKPITSTTKPVLGHLKNISLRQVEDKFCINERAR